MTDEGGRRIPLTILTGFLGAGKTTLLNRLLNGTHGLRVAVLVNDFGSVNIDAELVVGVEEEMISLANGCVCCQIRDDLLGAVERLVESERPPEHIVLEASGVADPAGIWATFASSRNPEWLRLDGVVCVVDTEQIFENLDDLPGLLMLKARQIGFADLVVLNKVDLVSPRHIAWVRQWIDTMMDRVRVVEAVGADVPTDILLGAAKGTTRPDPVDVDTGGHGPRFMTWTYETDQPLDADRLTEMISKQLPASVYRCKGFVVSGTEHRTMVLQSVARRCELTPAASDNRRELTQIVAIGTPAMDPEDLAAAFDSCVLEQSSADCLV